MFAVLTCNPARLLFPDINVFGYPSMFSAEEELREGGVIPDTLSVVEIASLVFDSRENVPKQKQQRTGTPLSMCYLSAKL